MLLDIIAALDSPALAPNIAECRARPQSRYAWNRLRHRLAALAGRDKLEWDLHPPLPEHEATGTSATAATMPGSRVPQPDCRLEVYLYALRSPFNVGGILRTADAIGASRVILHPDCPALDNSRLVRSAMGAANWVQTGVLAPEELGAYSEREGLEIVALETGGTDIGSFEFPRRLLLVLGSEETGIPPDFLEGLRRVSLPMYGKKSSLNVGVSFGIAAFSWRAACDKNHQK